jgi:formylglycine-generating enzyme required for sulfatase activity
MKHANTWTLCALGAAAFSMGAPAWGNSGPVVSNVTANQRGDGSNLIDVTYDLVDADGDPCTVWVNFSDDGGLSWRVPARTFSGDIGMGVAPGNGKAIVWDAGADMPGRVGNFQARVYADDGNGPENTVLVPGGWFPYQNVSDPESWVYVGTFLIDKYEVTNQFYAQFLNSDDPNGNHWDSRMEIDAYGDAGNYYYEAQTGRENYPIRYVSFYDAEAFRDWRNSQTGQTYRLPSAWEWEKAAAWDPVQNHYYLYGFHQDTIDCTWCNYRPAGYCVGDTTSVGSYDGTGGRQDAHSYYGCYDMSGNVWEWTSEVSGSYRVIRGGAWGASATYCQCTYRDNGTPSYRSGNVGFRLVLDPQ